MKATMCFLRAQNIHMFLEVKIDFEAVVEVVERNLGTKLRHLPQLRA